MLTVDTNIVIDLLQPDSPWYAWASSVADGRYGDVTMSAIAAGELAATLHERRSVPELLTAFDIAVADFGMAAALRAGRAQVEYRRSGGARTKLLGDFLIGAHAEVMQLPLATRDPKPYRRYFPDLTLITPETHNG